MGNSQPTARLERTCIGFPRESTAARRRLCAGIFLLFLFASAYMHQPVSKCPTAISRLDLLHALAHGKINIDIYRTNTPDVSLYDGHYFSDKAPGTAALALPGFMAVAGVLDVAGVGFESKPGWLYTSWAACVFSIGILTALGAVALFLWLSRFVPGRYALITTLGIFLGAAPLPYTTMMFSHALVVGFISIALWSIARTACRTPQLEVQRFDLLAGFCCGWVLASEYTAGMVVLGIALWLFAVRKRRVIPFCLTASPPLLLIPLYSWLCFHHPFMLPYSLNASFPEMKEGLYAIQWPDAETAYNLLASPTRGLFFWTPFLVMAGVGYWKLVDVDRRLFWLTYAVPVLQVVVISGRVWDWPAGPTLGPRYLAPILPLMALPCALGVRRFPKIGATLAAISVLVTTVATLVNAAPPASYYNPLLELHLPGLIKGDLAPNLGTLVGMPPWAVVAFYYAVLVGGIAWLFKRAGAGTALYTEFSPPRQGERK